MTTPNGNRKQLLKEVETFIQTAEDRGCYTDGQAENLRGSWHLFTTKAAGELVTPTATVDDVQPKVAALFNAYGATAKASASSIKAYTGRVERLLQDFVKWNGGDFMAWKTTLEKKPSATNGKGRSKGRRTTPPPAAPTTAREDTPDPTKQVHYLRLPNGGKAELRLPADLKAKDIAAVWSQLDGLKGYLEAQAAIGAGDDNGS